MNLSELIQAGLSQIGALSYGSAQSGSSASQVVDDTRDPGEGADDFVGGTLFVVQTATQAAPQGEFAKITAYEAATFDMAPLTAAVDEGDRYAVAGPTFAHEELLSLANDALRRFSIPLVDTSLTVGANQTEYTLPVGLKRHNLRSVEEQVNDTWRFLHDWRVTFTPPAATATLYLPRACTGSALRLTYMGAHPRLTAWDDIVSEYIHPELAKASMTERLANKLSTQAQNSAPPFARGFDKANTELEQAIVNYPIWQPAKRAGLVITRG